MTEQTLRLLQQARAAEKEQALFYRALSTIAEDRGAQDDVEALNGLLADEQHHLSRITVRLVELGHEPAETAVGTPAHSFEDWRNTAAQREQAEIERYQVLLAEDLDAETADVLRGILDVERQHAAHLGGKYTEA